jgi:hypothetical protein
LRLQVNSNCNKYKVRGQNEGIDLSNWGRSAKGGELRIETFKSDLEKESPNSVFVDVTTAKKLKLYMTDSSESCFRLLLTRRLFFIPFIIKIEELARSLTPF